MNKLFYLSLFLSHFIFAQNDCLQGNCKDGYGTKMYINGQYEGFFQDGKRTNSGSFQFKDYSMYIGTWSNDKMEGFGFIKINDSISTIIGIFKDGKLNGKGVKFFKDNTIEAAWFENDSVKSYYDFQKNLVEIGCVNGNCQNFYGRYKFENGDEFNGFFKENFMQFGSYVFANKTTYIGEFDSEGKMNGVGIYVYANGNYYFGNWKNSTYEGYGMFHNIVEDKKLVGYWKNGELQMESNE